MMDELHEVAAALVAPGKGILAADESAGTIKKRFDSIGVESTDENRRAYRELLFTAPGVEAYLWGVILFDETIRQASAGGEPFAALLASRGIIPGIKVDKGTKPLARAERRDHHRGARRAPRALRRVCRSRRAVRQMARRNLIWSGRPSEYAICSNAHALARYAALSQEAGLVPIVEPEVLMDGTQMIDESFHVTSRAHTPSTPSCAPTSASSPRSCPQAEHGSLGVRLPWRR